MLFLEGEDDVSLADNLVLCKLRSKIKIRRHNTKKLIVDKPQNIKIDVICCCGYLNCAEFSPDHVDRQESVSGNNNFFRGINFAGTRQFVVVKVVPGRIRV